MSDSNDECNDPGGHDGGNEALWTFRRSQQWLRDIEINCLFQEGRQPRLVFTTKSYSLFAPTPPLHVLHGLPHSTFCYSILTHQQYSPIHTHPAGEMEVAGRKGR